MTMIPPPSPPPQSYAMCPESSPSSCDSTTHSNSCNLESQMKLALFPTGILENTWVACSKATLNCCIDQLFTFTEMSVKTAFETGKKNNLLVDVGWLWCYIRFELNFMATLWDSWKQNGLSQSQTPSSPAFHNQRPVSDGRKLTAEQPPQKNKKQLQHRKECLVWTTEKIYLKKQK